VDSGVRERVSLIVKPEKKGLWAFWEILFEYVVEPLFTKTINLPHRSVNNQNEKQCQEKRQQDTKNDLFISG